jgi:GNAT superfamily N-acetyltransferase
MADVPALTALSSQLGYPTRADDLAQRLSRFLSRPDDHVILAALDDVSRVIGWIHVGRRESLETRPRAEILGLVVDGAFRRAGVGRALMSAAEEWAVARGFDEVILRSNVVRPESHPFYESIGYARVKTQHVYTKAVSART